MAIASHKNVENFKPWLNLSTVSKITSPKMQKMELITMLTKKNQLFTLEGQEESFSKVVMDVAEAELLIYPIVSKHF